MIIYEVYFDVEGKIIMRDVEAHSAEDAIATLLPQYDLPVAFVYDRERDLVFDPVMMTERGRTDEDSIPGTYPISPPPVMPPPAAREDRKAKKEAEKKKKKEEKVKDKPNKSP